jgi:U3 small nucleolar RNA-associated protein 5
MSTKRKLTQKLGHPAVKPSAKVFPKDKVDESKALVSGGWNAPVSKANPNSTIETITISSDEEEAKEYDEEDAEEESAAGDDVAMEDAAVEQDDNEENAEPSFGDLVRANASEPIDVAGAFEDQTVAYPKGTQIQPPSGASLGTVLTQALKTSDIALLESCLHTTDTNTIRATIQRLESPLAGTLLQKLAERLHRRPGRAGSLMVWVQWTLVTHGGYLATQRDLIKKLAELNRVIDGRAKGLQPLLSLKGKLDMLEAQMELRRSMQNQRRRMDEEDDDEGVIYVEDQDSEDETTAKRLSNGNLEFDDSASEVSEDMSMTNGVIADSEDEEEDSSDDGNGLLDNEAEETDADTGDEDEVDHDDQDSLGEEDESDDGVLAPPSKKRR